MSESKAHFATVPEALEAIRNGRMVVVIDDEDRENEGDLTLAAEFVTPEAINFMARFGRGLICLTLTEERADYLRLGPMTSENTSRFGTAFTESVEAREGVGKNGDWCVDFHQRFDLDEAVRGCSLIEPLAPFFVEDPVRTEAFQEDLPILRRMAKVPIAAGEEWGNRLPPRRIYASGSVPSRCARRF